MRYSQLGIAMAAYADALDSERFGLSFDIEGTSGLTVVVDRAILERLQFQIAFALSPQQPSVDPQ